MATHCPDLVGPPEECLGARVGRACCDVPGSVALGPSSVVPLQERPVSETESVRAVIRRVCRNHWWLLRPHTLCGPHKLANMPKASRTLCGGGARRRADILTNKPLTCTCRDPTGSWCVTAHYASFCWSDFSDLTLALPPMGNWGAPVYDHNGLRGGTNWTWEGEGGE